MKASWLPWPTQRLHAAVRSKATWGYVIYRTTYMHQSETAFSQITDLINSYIKHDLFSEYAATQTSELAAAEPTPYNEIWAHHHPIIMDDPTKFDRASIDSVRAHFRSWVDLQEGRHHLMMYPICIVIDEDSVREFLNASLSGGKSELERMGKRPIPYFKMIPAFSESDEYDSFMGGEYPRESSERIGLQPISQGREIAAILESDDDEYDGFLGG
jgi:hypothetical protein